MFINPDSGRLNRRFRFQVVFGLVVLIIVASVFYWAGEVQVPETELESDMISTVEELEEVAEIPEVISTSETQATKKAQVGPLVRIKHQVIPVEVRRTHAELAAGLSGWPNLPADEGMLFIFPEFSKPAFWMPDMNFPIDMVWIRDGEIVGITANVSNEFDQANPDFYYPPEPINYVLEVNAGFMARSGLTVGDQLTFENI
ncbi:MAG: hypothetical protein A2589_03535 [Candidatus Vogelbacteria bacterium RIFOXYD1_FULL_46_19]|uniref:DUF192 domain-containing protein n=1 Tax=Candidatus Vogelbacteria bacterium RIFOXYD1_FULL_46_19 TaxID=1802439 RepID=A0A1G2QF60_9BACT|nr:MAG: hypothetical protein A2589_03535 [Candidatus Vogelbacteria bacterium RIFOXYD1_FULL_46_19]